MPNTAPPKTKPPKRKQTRPRRGIRIAPGIRAADLFEHCALTEDEREALGLSHMGHDGEF